MYKPFGKFDLAAVAVGIHHLLGLEGHYSAHHQIGSWAELQGSSKKYPKEHHKISPITLTISIVLIDIGIYTLVVFLVLVVVPSTDVTSR